jgi:membrane protein implicated in regulation of membrane protease activity
MENEINWLAILIVFVLGSLLLIVIYWAYLAYKRDQEIEKYEKRAEELKTQGCKVVYYNDTTGTISYIGKDGKRHSESLFQGYRSHYKG